MNWPSDKPSELVSQSDSVLKAVLEGLIYAVLTASKRLRATHFAVF
jgi:hypothetical protein